MDIKKAAIEMLTVINDEESYMSLPDYDTSFGINHLKDMCESIINGEVTGEKAHRWLGWIQCAVCLGGGATLEFVKDINHNA